MNINFVEKGKLIVKDLASIRRLFFFFLIFVMFANSRYNVFALEFIVSTFLHFCTNLITFYLFLILYLKCWNTLT